MTMITTVHLPEIRGSYQHEAPLKELVWFRAGGPAEVLFRPQDVKDLAAFLAARPSGLPLTIIGVGSNLLVRDGGIKGVVIRLPAAAFGKIRSEGTRLTVGAAALDSAVARAAADAGIGGLEFLRGVPGTIGGALRMNAGCYGREIKDVFVAATALDGQGRQLSLGPDDMGFGYRRSALPEDVVFVEAVLEGHREDPDSVRATMQKLLSEREAAQPVRAKTGGSTFKNPPGQKAWSLIDGAGCRGLRRGEAMVSDKHCNFLINLGEARAADLEALGEEVRAKVEARFGITLEWEIKRVGQA